MNILVLNLPPKCISSSLHFSLYGTQVKGMFLADFQLLSILPKSFPVSTPTARKQHY